LEGNIMQYNTNTYVITTGAGRHFHLFGDCRALAQGQRNSDKFNRTIWYVTGETLLSDAIDDGMFGCRECFKRAGESIPAEADRVKVYAARAQARAERRAAKAAALAAKAEAKVAAVETSTEVPVIDAEVERMILAIMAYLSQFNLTVAAAA